MSKDWCKRTLGEVCEFQSGSVFKRQFQGNSSGEYPFIKVSDMNSPGNNLRIQESRNWVNEDVVKVSKLRLAPVDATVFAKIGEALKQNRLRILTRPTIIDNNMMGAIPNTDLVDSTFLFYAMHQFDFGQIADGTALPYLTITSLSNLPIPIPPISEQRAIAHILGTLDDKIELNRRMNQTLEEMARAIYKDWFVDFGPSRAKIEGRKRYLPTELWDIFPNRLVNSEVGKIPEGWKVKPLGEICTFRAGSAFPKASQGNSSGTYPFAKVSDMNLPENSVSILGAANWVGEDDLSGLKAKPLPKGTTVFAKIGEALKHNRFRLVTIPTIVDNNIMGAIPDANLIDPLILFHALSGFDMGEVAGGTALPYLTINTLASLLIPIPPANEQRVMGQPLKAFNEKLIANDRECQQLSEKRGALLPKLVSGEVRVGS